jgi:nitrite reductase (NADH) small subunit
MSTLWVPICQVSEIPVLGSRVVTHSPANIALFRTRNDEVFALRDQCPHKKGPLSQGIVHGNSVTCPLHAWNISLVDGMALAPDEGCAARYSVNVQDGTVHLSKAELDA